MKEFYGLAFETDARALIPRPETEKLVEMATDEVMRRLASALRPAGARDLRVVDVGTGSGAIAVALAVSLRRLNAIDSVELLAVDISPDALGLAENAVGHAVADRITFAEAGPAPTVRAGSTWSSPTCHTSATTRWPACPSRPRSGRRSRSTVARTALEVIGRLLDRLPATLAVDGRPCSRSVPTRARRSWSWSPRNWPAGLRGRARHWPELPRVARIARAPRASRSARASRRASSGACPSSRHPTRSCHIRLVALDIDGTLVGDDWRSDPTPGRRSARRDRGVIVSLVTGRMVSGADAFRARARLDSAGRRLSGAPDPRDARRRFRPARTPARHADAAEVARQMRGTGRAIAGSITISTTSSA
jgi:hypothetical protein